MILDKVYFFVTRAHSELYSESIQDLVNGAASGPV